MSNLLKINQFESSNIVVAAPKPLGNMGGKSVNINYKFPDGQSPITLQTPWMRSYGINKWEDPNNSSAAPKLSVPLSFLGVEADEKIGEFKAFLEELDEWAIDAAHKNSWEWLKTKTVPRDTIAFNYTRTLKVPLDKATGEPNGKPANMKLKLNLTDSGYSATFFTVDKKAIPTADVESVFTMGSKVRGLIQCTGFWIAAGKFGLTWKLKQMIIDPPSRIGKEYAFDDDECESTPVAPTKKVTPAPTPKVVEPEVMVDDEEEETPAPIAKKSVPAPSAEEEESTAPKKVVRKVIAKK